MKVLRIELTQGEALGLQELLEAYLKEHASDRFCEAKEGFTPENKMRSDQFHLLSVVLDVLSGALEKGEAMITVGQLLEWLQQFPPGAIVYGYEGLRGMEPPSSIVVVSPETFLEVGSIDTPQPRGR